MNEPAIRTEEQIISLFPDRETLICRGWVLKRMEGQLLVYPLYYKSSEGDIPANTRRCEESSGQCGAGCVFRIVEHTNYHLSSILTDNGYGPEKCGAVGECSLTGDAGKLCMKEKVQGELFLKNRNGGTEYVMAGETAIGIKRQGLLFLPDGNLPDTGLEDILRFAAANGIVRILADIPGGEEELPEQYGRLGFCRAYLYRCYQKNQEAIMGITLGKQMPEVVGADVYDRTGNGHLGIIEFPVPVLKGNVEVIKSIREKLYEPEFSDLTVVDFSDLAQGCKTYDEFIEKMKDVSETKLNYFGIAICGAKKKVNKLTGSMALLR